ncbi:MAG: AAA family ATPase [Leptolyngbyaceae cyanobacterium MO_188.B28]|nr:AAA family ATPase [Leptolyngbyaceae cyanobacterium MO_188.B28]
MSEVALHKLPILVVVTGRPGSGKTTLAHALAREIRCPAICRDEIKEGLVNTTNNSGEPGDDIAWKVYDVFFETLGLLLSHSITLVSEAAFQHKLWEPKLFQLEKIARIRIVHCAIDPKLARSRFIQRALSDPKRTRFHNDGAMVEAIDGTEAPISNYKPPIFDAPTLTVDTSDGYQPKFEAIVSFACD